MRPGARCRRRRLLPEAARPHAAEARAVVDAARRADRLLGVDLSYRFTAAMQAHPRAGPQSGELGQRLRGRSRLPQCLRARTSRWFCDPSSSGGGCLIDLGVHLVDLALWLFDFPDVETATATLCAMDGQSGAGEVEDYAIAELALANGVQVRLACSWNLNAGRDAVIEATVSGTQGGAAMRNGDGSFFDFSATHFRGRDSTPIASPPDEWGGRAAADWVRKLAIGRRFGASTDGLLETANVLDRLYGRR